METNDTLQWTDLDENSKKTCICNAGSKRSISDNANGTNSGTKNADQFHEHRMKMYEDNRFRRIGKGSSRITDKIWRQG